MIDQEIFLDPNRLVPSSSIRDCILLELSNNPNMSLMVMLIARYMHETGMTPSETLRKFLAQADGANEPAIREAIAVIENGLSVGGAVSDPL